MRNSYASILVFKFLDELILAASLSFEESDGLLVVSEALRILLLPGNPLILCAF